MTQESLTSKRWRCTSITLHRWMGPVEQASQMSGIFSGGEADLRARLLTVTSGSPNQKNSSPVARVRDLF